MFHDLPASLKYLLAQERDSWSPKNTAIYVLVTKFAQSRKTDFNIIVHVHTRKLGTAQKKIYLFHCQEIMRKGHI